MALKSLASGSATATVGTAWASVQVFSSLSLLARARMPVMTIAAATQTARTPKIPSLRRETGFELLSFPSIGIEELARIWPRLRDFPPKITEQLEIDAKYDVYLSRQAADIAAFRRDENLDLPADIDYGGVQGLSNEARQKLAAVRPRTIGQAGRIDGLTPAALTLLVGHLRKGRKGNPKSAAG